MENKKIISIKLNKHVVKLTFDDKTSLKINESTYISFNLYINKNIDTKTLNKIKESSKEEDVFDYATKKLNERNYTEQKLMDLIYKKFGKVKCVNNVIKRLQDSKIINEDETVKKVIENAEIKHFGYNKIVNQLRTMKVSEKRIKEIKLDDNFDEIQANALYVSNKHKGKGKNFFQTKQYFYNLLLRNGFDDSISNLIVDKNVKYNHNYEINVLKLDYSKCLAKYKSKLSGKELENKVISYLINKGYHIDDIKSMGETRDEMD